MERPSIPEHLPDALAAIREGLHLRWNPRAVVSRLGTIDATGKATEPQYEPRWELWDTDPEGRDYMVMRVQHTDGSFRQPGDWLVRTVNKLNPARYGGNLNRMVQELIDEPEVLREAGTRKDSDDLIEMAARWAEWGETPKSGAALTYRGKRLLSA